MAAISFPRTIPSMTIETVNCGFLRIRDNTLYATSPYIVGGHDLRSNYGILILVDYSTNNITFTNEPLYTQLENNDLPSTWNIDIPNIQYYYKIKAYWCLKVTEITTLLSADTIVYNSTDLNFYSFDVGTGAYTLIDTVTDWSSYCDSNTTMFQYEEILFYEKTSNYVVTKAACHQYYICDRSNNDSEKTYGIYTPGTSLTDSAPLLSGTYDPIDDNPFLLDLTTLGDGVYVIRIDGGNTYWQYPIYDFCSIQICQESLIRDILCTDTDCVSTCDANYILENTNKRNTLNMISAVYDDIIGKINAERMEYLGIYSIDPDRAATLQEVDNLITKLIEITLRCGVCNDIDTNNLPIVEPPCLTC